MIMQVAPTRSPVRKHPPAAPASRCEAARKREVCLVARLRSDERVTCEALYEQYGARMLAVARRLLRTEEDAADAVHDAFLAAFVSLSRFRAQSQISTWLHRIVVNQCLMRRRRQKRRATVSLEALSSSSKHGDAAWPAAARNCDDAAALMDKVEQRSAIRRCIQLLPDSYREVLILRDIDEYDTGETAALLGVSRGAIKTRLHRARQALGESLSALECV
jgi:RNA polymerase sigma-70 factor (ECF subfamily)